MYFILQSIFTFVVFSQIVFLTTVFYGNKKHTQNYDLKIQSWVYPSFIHKLHSVSITYMDKIF